MLEYLTQLPCETLGQHILGFLELIDIIQWENAAASQKSQQLLRAVLPFCPPLIFSNSWNRIQFNHTVSNWFSTRRCRVQFMRIPIESLCEVNFEHSVLYDITLCLKEKASLKDIGLLNDPNIRDKITNLDIKSAQDPAVMEVLFSLLSNSNSVRNLIIESSNPLRWMEHIKKIGPSLQEFFIGSFSSLKVFKAVVECCPYLEKLSLRFLSDSNLLQDIASNCPHLCSLDILLSYSLTTVADADLTAFAEKCPQLEELSLECPQLTDQSVIALAQHCSRLKKLKLDGGTYTVASLIALSERGLPLEELVISWIPIPSAEIAAQCAHALSRIPQLSTRRSNGSVVDMHYALQYMTGLRELCLDSSEDHLLVPHLLLQLQGKCCAGLESLIIADTSITPQQLSELVRGCPQLHTLGIDHPTCSSDGVLVELARSCPHLQKVTLHCLCSMTEEGVLTLAAHCRQLREIHLPYFTVTEKTVRQLAQHCRRLTKLHLSMMEFLTQLPCETLGQHILGFLELNDIMQWEKAAASQKSQQLLKAILPYCPTLVVSDSWNRVKFDHIVCNWFSNRRCRVQFMRIPIESLCEVNFENNVLYDSTLCLKSKASLKEIALLNDPYIRDKITKLEIRGEQDPAVMEVLFSLLTGSSVRSLDIQESNSLRWMEHIKKIGPCLRELSIDDSESLKVFKAVVECCPYLEKLRIFIRYEKIESNMLQSIASNCPHIRSIDLSYKLIYNASAVIDADLTAFAEKCPQLEELSLTCEQLTDQSVIALAQHCSRLKKMKLDGGRYTAASLIALSERGLPLQELVIPWIPITSAEIAAQCAHALSRIRQLSTHRSNAAVIDMHYALQYMTGVCILTLDSSVDHLLVPHLLLLLQGQFCAGLESLSIWPHSSITPQQLSEIAAECPQLHTLTIYNPTCSTDAVLVVLVRSWSHLQKVTLYSSEVTEVGLLALAPHCRQLREIDLVGTTVTEETVRQLAQHCRRLTELHVSVSEGEGMAQHYGHYKQYTSKEIRALRENTSSRAWWLGGDSHSYTLYTQNILGVCALLVVVYAYMVYKY